MHYWSREEDLVTAEAGPLPRHDQRQGQRRRSAITGGEGSRTVRRSPLPRGGRATFIVAIVDDLPGMQGKGTWTFMVLGLAAVPACILWDLVARHIGEINAMISAFMLQIVGILLPVLTPDLGMTLLGAVLFGGTFIGIVSLVLTMAGRFYPTRPAKMMGKMTISYGIAQIAAPAITGQLARGQGSYANGLYLAAAVMLLGAACMLVLKLRHEAELPTSGIIADRPPT